MWAKLFSILRLVLTFAESFQRLESRVKEQGEQIRELVMGQTRLQFEIQLQKERAAHEREQERLKLENQQLRERLERLERLSLPPKPPDD